MIKIRLKVLGEIEQFLASGHIKTFIEARHEIYTYIIFTLTNIYNNIYIASKIFKNFDSKQ